jgi:hypothetical protein
LIVTLRWSPQGSRSRARDQLCAAVEAGLLDRDAAIAASGIGQKRGVASASVEAGPLDRDAAISPLRAPNPAPHAGATTREQRTAS